MPVQPGDVPVDPTPVPSRNVGALLISVVFLAFAKGDNHATKT